VKVAVAEERRLAVVDVKGLEVLEANDLVELGHGCGICFRSAEVVACGKDVAGVKAYTDTILVVDKPDDLGKVGETATDSIALCSHSLEYSDNFTAGRVIVGLVDVGCNGADAVFARRGVRIAGVEVVELDAQGVAAREVIEERVVRLLLALGVGMGEVDKV
jgi:hypothetical protein